MKASICCLRFNSSATAKFWAVVSAFYRRVEKETNLVDDRNKHLEYDDYLCISTGVFWYNNHHNWQKGTIHREKRPQAKPASIVTRLRSDLSALAADMLDSLLHTILSSNFQTRISVQFLASHGVCSREESYLVHAKE